MMSSRPSGWLRRASRAVVPAAAAFVLGLLAVPAVASGDAGFAQTVRVTEQRAMRRLAATARRTPPGRFAYFTVGNVWKCSGPDGWAAGYVPGGLWSCYQLSGLRWWRDEAMARQAAIGAARLTEDSLDLGALFFPSYARGYRLTGDPRLRAKALKAASCAAQRYNSVVGAMLSRPRGDFNVIIDSLMKSQLLWWAVKNGAPAEFAEIARRHALTTARDFLRADGSTYHIVYYDALTGAVIRRGQSSGYSQDSTWARGQAWAILGFAAGYRETGDGDLLVAARAVSDWYLAHLPADMVPYWDFQAPDIPLAARDSSAAAIAAAGLLDLARVDPDAERRLRYESGARATLASLMSADYFSSGANPAVLLHGTYIWRGGITDRGIAYGDAFFLEALLRLRRLPPAVPALALAEARGGSGAAAAAVDGDLGTWWGVRGARALDLRLSTTQEVGAVRVALYRGDDCAARLRISVSSDGRRWHFVRQTMTSGETASYETLDFAPHTARWVRLQCAGTTRGSVGRIAEVEVYPAL
ncbi:MAG: discoidin domain-containing protein [Actinobacteria bacterium]|nr:discoidin domain-containing protein [Actinomycetota bacterium]